MLATIVHFILILFDLNGIYGLSMIIRHILIDLISKDCVFIENQYNIQFELVENIL